MEDLLKRARPAGVGVFLATQSPGDLDYKCKENVRTWLLGRVKEPRALEKLRPMLAAGRPDTADKLAGQEAGEFSLLRESEVLPVRSDESIVRTEQVPEDRIAQLAWAIDRTQPGRQLVTAATWRQSGIRPLDLTIGLTNAARSRRRASPS